MVSLICVWLGLVIEKEIFIISLTFLIMPKIRKISVFDANRQQRISDSQSTPQKNIYLKTTFLWEGNLRYFFQIKGK